jgi:hypothetical protein
MGAQQLTWLMGLLGLTDAQQAQIKPILVSTQSQMKAIFQNTSLTADQKHAQMKTLLDSTANQIETYLTPDQVSQLESLRQIRDSLIAGQAGQ